MDDLRFLFWKYIKWISFSSFPEFEWLDDFDYLGEGSRETTVNLMHLNQLIIGILFHSSQFLDFLCAFDRSFGWMAANPVNFGEPLYPPAILFTNLWRLEGEIRSKSCLILNLSGNFKKWDRVNCCIQILRHPCLIIWAQGRRLWIWCT